MSAGSAKDGRHDLAGGLFVAVASVLFGGVVILGKSLPRSLPVPSILAVRFGIAALTLACILALRRQTLRPAPGEVWRTVLLGAAGYAVESSFFFFALARGSAAAVTLLFFTYPALVAVFSALLGKGLPGWLVVGALVAAVAGAGLVATSGSGLDISAAGIGFALASAFTFSLYLLGVEALVTRTPPLAAAMWVSGSASAALAIFALAGGADRFPEGAGEWIRVAAMGLLTAGAFVLLFLGLRRVGAVRTAIIAAMEPVATALMAVWILGDTLRPGVLLGGALILVGTVAASVARGGIEPEIP
jgi:drug/metabolite transporter (DMT)-like permease